MSFRFVPVQSDVTITNITQTQGLIPLQLGDAKLITDFQHLIHVINLKTYNDNINTIKQTLDRIEETRFTASQLRTTKLKLNNLSAKLDILTPNYRKKRGLVNALGSAIKFITGNMDYKDAEELNKNIDNLTRGNTQIKTTLKNQMMLNNKMITRFENITNHINEEQNLIERSIMMIQNQTRNAINPSVNAIIQMQNLLQISFNIDILTDHLNDIAESVVLARLNTVPKLILTTDELNEIHNILNNATDIISPEHIYELLQLTAYYNDTNIIFDIQIPIISNELFKLLHIIKTPINNTLEIITGEYALINNDNLYLFDNRCKQIEQKFYCNYETQYERNRDCLKSILLREETVACHLRDIGLTTDIIYPEPNYLVLINPPIGNITTVCNNVTKSLPIKSSSVINFNECKILFNNVWYTDKPNIHQENISTITFQTSFSNNITTLSIRDELTLPKLDQYRFQNKANIEFLQTDSDNYKTISYSAFGIISSIIIILSIILVIRKPIKLIYSITHNNNEVLATNDPKPLWPSLHSGEGGVTYSHQ